MVQGDARTDPLQLPAAERARTVKRGEYPPTSSGVTSAIRRQCTPAAQPQRNNGDDAERRGRKAPALVLNAIRAAKIQFFFSPATTFTVIPSFSSADGFVTITIPSAIPPRISIVAP